MAECQQVAYADLSLTKDTKGRLTVSKAYCVYENVDILPRRRRVKGQGHTYQNQLEATTSSTEEPEYVELISDDDDDDDDNDEEEDDDYEEPDENDDEKVDKKSSDDESDTDTHSYIDLEEENITESVRPPTRLMRCAPCSAQESCYDLARSYRQRVVKPPAKMSPAGMVSLPDDRIVVVTQTGEIILFDGDSRFLFLREFLERYEDVTVIDESTIATTSGFSIRFYSLHGSNIVELGDRLINFEYTGGISVHGIHHFHGKLVVSCNIQTVYSTEKPFLRILDLRGKLIRTIGKPDFQVPSRITCSWDGKMIFVCDQDLNKVSCLTNNGTVQWERIVETKPRDIELVNDSEIFIIYEESNLVIGLSAATGKLKSKAEVNTHSSPSVHIPSMLSYQRQKRQLIFCNEELVVGIPNFIHPLKVRKSRGKIKKSISFSKLHGKKLLAQMWDM